MDNERKADPRWEHIGNPACHDEEFRCTSCGRVRSISNRSDQFQTVGHPEPCPCWSEKSEQERQVK